MIRYVCDNCGITERAPTGLMGETCRPNRWIVKNFNGSEYHFCSHGCVDAAKLRVDSNRAADKNFDGIFTEN
jgi:hypothetical protein